MKREPNTTNYIKISEPSVPVTQDRLNKLPKCKLSLNFLINPNRVGAFNKDRLTQVMSCIY